MAPLDRKGRYERSEYHNERQDQQSTRSIRSHPSMPSRRPPSLERQDAFADTRTRKDRVIPRCYLDNNGRTSRLRHQLKGGSAHRLVIIDGIMLLHEKETRPQWLKVGNTQSLGKRRRDIYRTPMQGVRREEKEEWQHQRPQKARKTA